MSLLYLLPGLACNYFFIVFLEGFQNKNSGTKLIAKDATDAKTPANSTFPRPEPDGRRPGQGFGPKSEKTSLNLILLTRARPGLVLTNIWKNVYANVRDIGSNLALTEVMPTGASSPTKRVCGYCCHVRPLIWLFLACPIYCPLQFPICFRILCFKGTGRFQYRPKD